jgi:hypothetical protein
MINELTMLKILIKDAQNFDKHLDKFALVKFKI